MLSIPGLPLLDKTRLIGGCSRLGLRSDARRLVREVEGLPATLWGSRGGRIGVHNPAQAIFLRGYAPAEGDRPIEDREALDHLPYVRELIETTIPGRPMRCLLAQLPAGSVIAPHIDQAPYFGQTIRIHVPVVTSEDVWMAASGLGYRMRPGEIWALNNSATHGVWNADPERARTHLICDFVPDEALLGLLASAERDLGVRDQALAARLDDARMRMPA